jgi:hypothetical protein
MGKKSTRKARKAKTWALGVFEVRGLAWSPPQDAGIHCGEEDCDAGDGGEDDGSNKLLAEGAVPLHHYDHCKFETYWTE